MGAGEAMAFTLTHTHTHAHTHAHAQILSHMLTHTLTLVHMHTQSFLSRSFLSPILTLKHTQFFSKLFLSILLSLFLDQTLNVQTQSQEFLKKFNHPIFLRIVVLRHIWHTFSLLLMSSLSLPMTVVLCLFDLPFSDLLSLYLSLSLKLFVFPRWSINLLLLAGCTFCVGLSEDESTDLVLFWTKLIEEKATSRMF